MGSKKGCIFAAELNENDGVLAQVARAFDWQSKGHRFDSDILHKRGSDEPLFLFHHTSRFSVYSENLVYPKSVIRYDSNRLLHNNTILHSVIFLMTVIRKMIIRKYPIDGLKGQKQIAYGYAVGFGNIRCRPERAKESCFCPFRAIGLHLIYPRRCLGLLSRCPVGAFR